MTVYLQRLALYRLQRRNPGGPTPCSDGLRDVAGSERFMPEPGLVQAALRLLRCRLIELGEGYDCLPLNPVGEILDGLVTAAQRM